MSTTENGKRTNNSSIILVPSEWLSNKYEYIQLISFVYYGSCVNFFLWLLVIVYRIGPFLNLSCNILRWKCEREVKLQFWICWNFAFQTRSKSNFTKKRKRNQTVVCRIVYIYVRLTLNECFSCFFRYEVVNE